MIYLLKYHTMAEKPPRTVQNNLLISVIVIIVGELMSIGKTLSIQQLGETFATIPVWKSGLMLLIGLISVLPMVGYDIILNRMLEQKQNPRYLFETSWLINTINNIAGFGGFVSVGLRSELYGQRKRAET